MLRTKSILAGFESEDGLRVSVMSRHTLTDGLTPDPRITEDLYDDWRPMLAPPAKLIGDYYKRGLDWEYFEQRFMDHLSDPFVSLALERLIYEALNSNVTIMCIEEAPERCHRRLVAEQCQIIAPELTIYMR